MEPNTTEVSGLFAPATVASVLGWLLLSRREAEGGVGLTYASLPGPLFLLLLS